MLKMFGYRKLGVVLIATWLVTSFSAKPTSTKEKGLLMSAQEKSRVRAPELTGGRGWLNTGKPLSLVALKGKVVLLDFWTYGCINCIHIIPDLKKLEAKYPNQLVVIGVHSAKFENEKQTENIRRIILRYQIEHPVYNDADFRVWQSYGIRAWPTQVLIDPAGYVVGKASGEGNYELIDREVARLIDDFRKRGLLNEEPLDLTLERASVGDLPLAFPGKVIADQKSDRLYIADSNHNRIVIARLDGTLLEVIGSGESGQADGTFDKANFNRPQGLALAGNLLFVADTENHLIRQVDLKSRAVTTIAGTGVQTRDYFKAGSARTIALSSPWDLQVVDRWLYIAMAGPHQIWRLDLDKKEISTFAGSGREARLDGAVLEAGFAQPSGLAARGETLYVADSESNIIRAIDLAKQRVKTIVGGDLFEFGDVDGKGDDVRLQHPLGVFPYGEKVLIADTYNHKIKELDPQRQSVRTLLGTGKPGQTDGATPSFYEPGGLSVAGDKLYIADTNNHAIRVADLKLNTTSTLRLKGLEPPSTNTSLSVDSAPNQKEIRLPSQRLRASAEVKVIVQVDLPAGYHLNPSAPQRFSAAVEKGSEHLSFVYKSPTGPGSGKISETSRTLQLPLRLNMRTLSPGTGELRVQLTIYYCREDNTGTCQISTLAWIAPVEVIDGPETPNELRIQGKVDIE
jgi:DNA-binding beta-propeller fold protein YncE